MIYSFITGVLFAAMIVVGVVLFALNHIAKRKKSGKKTVPKAVSVALVACGIVCLAVIPASFHTVEAGTVAVVKKMGVIDNVEGSGTYFDFWLTKKYELYDAKVQQVEIAMDAYTSDAQSMDISMVVQFQIRQDKVEEIALNYGGLAALTNRIQSVAIERTKATLSKYQAEKLIEERNTISPTVEKEISDAIGDKYYVTFNSAVLTDITFSDAFEAAVEAKMMAQQEKLQAQYENEKKKEQADTALYVAEQEAKALLANAQAKADAQVAIAEADARAILLKSVEIARMLGYKVKGTPQTVTDAEGNTTQETVYEILYDDTHTGADIAEYMKYIEYLSAWDGKLPQVVGDGKGFMITVPMPDGTTGE
ncbi:MAG: prohibitin family protein [Corallococcus sp.]|nr:prohibitin family protein [Corallococcus sp.]